MTQTNKAKLIIIGAIAALLTLTGCTTVPQSENITHRLSTGVNFKSTDAILDDLDRAEKYIHEGEVFTLVITSPGGAVLPYKSLGDRLNKSELLIHTKVHSYANSIGAMMFLLGDIRTIREDATLTFHYARFIKNKQHVTVPLLIKYLSGKELPEDMVKAIKNLGFSPEAALSILSNVNSSLREIVISEVGEEVANKLLISGKDVTITGKEALDMGVATSTYTLQTVKKRSFIHLTDDQKPL